MDFENIQSLIDLGFVGFHKISSLKLDASPIPKIQGVYMVLRPDDGDVVFVEIGTGGFFKDRNPNVAISKLKKNWVEKARVIYIGKAGGFNSSATLNSRLKQYLNFGQGKKIGHWGGRYIWQIKNIDDYVLCWKEFPSNQPRDVEVELLGLFSEKYGKFPFANLSA
jgi:hypothetical protein